MKINNLIIGALLIVLGLAVFAYYDQVYKPQNESRIMLREADFFLERGDKDSVNQSINMFVKIISRYPDSKVAVEGYYKIAKAYEKIGLYRLAYLKYSYIIKKFNTRINNKFRSEILSRLASIKVRKNYTDEANFQLYSLLTNSDDNEFRSRVYSEIGHSYLKSGNNKKAQKSFEIALNEYGENEEALLGKARSFIKLGRDADAYNIYDDFLKYFGALSQYTDDVLRSYKTHAYKSGLKAYRAKNYYGAIGFFRRLLKHFPGDSISENSLYWIGESYYGLRQYGRAITFFNKTLTNGFYHKDQDALLKKGFTYFTMKNFERAIDDLNRYIHLYPRGKFIESAKKWKNISDKELYYKTNPDIDNNEGDDIIDSDIEKKPGKRKKPDDNDIFSINEEEMANSEKNEEVVSSEISRENSIELEDITEI